MNVIVVLLMLGFGLFSSSGPAPVDAGAGPEPAIATIRPDSGQVQLCRPPENIAEEPCA